MSVVPFRQVAWILGLRCCKHEEGSVEAITYSGNYVLKIFNKITTKSISLEFLVSSLLIQEKFVIYSWFLLISCYGISVLNSFDFYSSPLYLAGPICI